MSASQCWAEYLSLTEYRIPNIVNKLDWGVDKVKPKVWLKYSL